MGHNLASDASCAFGGTGDLNSTNLLLDPLANNGGSTMTHALLPGSPAIDAVPLASCTVSTDQRGESRPQGAACDIGAFELVQVLTVAIDIKPGTFPNPLSLKSKGPIPVAILSTATFDATTVNPSTVCFGDADTPAERDCTEAHSTGHIQDVDGDGDLDLLLHYETQQTGIDPGDTQACLTGQTFGGIPIQGCDSVKIVSAAGLSAAPGLRVSSILATSNPTKRAQIIQFAVQGQGIESVQAQVFALSGKLVYDSGFVEGNALSWNLLSDRGKRVANGVYLYVVMVRGFSGEVIRSEVKKLVVLR